MHNQKHCDKWDCEECKTCRDCEKDPVIVWLNVGKFCQECFEKEYIKQNGDYRKDKNI